MQEITTITTLVPLRRQALVLTKNGIRGRKRLFAYIVVMVLLAAVVLAFCIAGIETTLTTALPKSWQTWLDQLPFVTQFNGVVDNLLAGAVGGLVVNMAVRGFRIGDKQGYVHELRDIINSARPNYNLSVVGAMELLQIQDTTVYELGPMLQAIQDHEYNNLPYQILFGSTFVKTSDRYARLRLAWDRDDGFYLIETSSTNKATLVQG